MFSGEYINKPGKLIFRFRGLHEADDEIQVKGDDGWERFLPKVRVSERDVKEGGAKRRAAHLVSIKAAGAPEADLARIEADMATGEKIKYYENIVRTDLKQRAAFTAYRDATEKARKVLENAFAEAAKILGV